MRYTEALSQCSSWSNGVSK